RAAAVVVKMRVADEEDFCVAEFEAELFDAGLEQRYVGFHIAVDQDVSLWGGDEIACEALAADIVEIAGDLEWREGLRPRGVKLCDCAPGEEQRKNEEENAAAQSRFHRASIASV